MFNTRVFSLFFVGIAAAMAEPAMAVTYVSDYEIVTQETALNTIPQKQLVATCPAGKKVLGAGWAALDSTGAFLHGRVLTSTIMDSGSSWFFNVQNISAWDPNWKLQASLTCAKVASRT